MRDPDRDGTDPGAAAESRVLQSILDSMSDGVAVIDERGRFLHFNPAAARILGIGPVDAPPSAWPRTYGFFEPDQVTPFPADRLPLVRARRGEQVDDELIFVRPAGGGPGVWLSINSRPLRDRTGKPRGAVSVLRDVTRRVEAERALARSAQELARSNAELEQFAYVASHDLQEPLRLIGGYADLLRRRHGERLDAEARGFLDAIAQSAGRMTDLIRDLLALSRAGSAPLKRETVEASVLCDRALGQLEAAIAAEGAVVTRDALPRVSGDPTQLVQVFQNLIGNAIKFHGEATPRVHVGAAIEGGEAILSVRDEGIGIEAGSFEEIFGSFRRLHERGRYAGTGLGLAICRKVVERHGGRIWVESAPGRGSTFSFTLPLAGAGRPGGSRGR